MLPLLLLLGAVQLAAEWDRFRGPNGTGVSDAKGLPAEFGPEKNVAWKAAVPFGRSSPIVAGGRVFVTAAEGENLVTLAFDAATGRVTRNHRGEDLDLSQPCYEPTKGFFGGRGISTST